MSADALLLAQTAAELVTWQERLSSPFANHRLQLLCSVLVGAVLGLLGCFVVLRRMALIGDAVSHAVLPGVVIAFLLVGTGVTGLFTGALLAGVLTAIGINLVTRYSRVKEDAAIGIVFTAMFALGVILISALPAGTHFDLKCFLFGDPLAVQAEDLAMILLIAPLVVAVIVLLFHPLKLMCFDATLARTLGFNTTALHYLLMILLSATVVAALRSVGVIMAVAMLITPAAVAYQATNRLAPMLLVAAGAGALSAGLGMFLAFMVDWPPGPAMVLVATVQFMLAMIFAPERGLLTVWRRRRRIRRHILEEDVLKALVRHEESPAIAPADLGVALPDAKAARVSEALAGLSRAGHVSVHGDRATLTDPGRRRALELLRAHRLWETYLAAQDVADPNLHDAAERLEHAHDLADLLADTLGDPQRDPHGHPIPRPAQEPRDLSSD
jgi:ABC-type Mn2+/Zn2+ transport system permease subunit/Mn-dependent DtxR family transcriptional regulator